MAKASARPPAAIPSLPPARAPSVGSRVVVRLIQAWALLLVIGGMVLSLHALYAALVRAFR